jgi:hypothetical protein
MAFNPFGTTTIWPVSRAELREALVRETHIAIGSHCLAQRNQKRSKSAGLEQTPVLS